MRSLFDDTGGGDDDALLRPSGLGALLLDSLHDIHALDDLTEDDVLAVKPRGNHRCDEELENRYRVGVIPTCIEGRNAPESRWCSVRR